MLAHLAHFIFVIFFNHIKHIFIFTNSRNISVPNQVYYSVTYIFHLTLRIFVLILNGVDAVMMIFDGKLMLTLYPNDGWLMIFVHLVCKLSNTRQQHIAAVHPEVFCFWLLAWKQQFIHPFFNDVNVALLQVFLAIHRCDCRGHTAHLILLSNIS